MQVSNSTGHDTDYKVTSSGGSYSTVYQTPPAQEEQFLPPTAETEERDWSSLGQYRFVEHEPDCAGPWEVTFRFTDASGVETWKRVVVEHPSAQVLLAESDGCFEVKVLYPDPQEIAA